MFMNILLGFIPLSLLMKYVLHSPPLWVFAASVLAIVPLADWLRRGTEHVAAHAGPTIGGLLNVTFGNMAELIIAIFILLDGNTQVVKAQITGSIIGNALLGLGLAVVAAGVARVPQRFNAANAGQLSAMLFLTVIALTLPAIFDYTEQLPAFSAGGAGVRGTLDERLSLGVAVLLIVVYLLNLVYTLVTHKDAFSLDSTHEGADGAAGGGHGPAKPWSLPVALGVLLGGTALIALESEMLSGALEDTAGQLGLTPFFLGVVVLAVVGNFAEYISGMYFARQGQMGLAVNISLGATIQVALLTAPLLVVIGYFTGHPMNLVFGSPLELIAIIAVALIVTSVTKDGETTWFEGVLLLAVYAALAMAFFFVTPRDETRPQTYAPPSPSALSARA